MALSARVADVSTTGHTTPAVARPAHLAAPHPIRLSLAVHVPHPAPTDDKQQEQQQASAQPAQPQYEMLEVMPEEAIKDLKLRMLTRAFNRPPGTGCLVFGEVNDAVRAGLVRAAAAGSDFLHIFAPASAIESVSVRTLRREVSLTNAATAAEAARAGAGALPLVVAAPRAGAPAPAAVAAAAVVHLLVHKSAKVAWRHGANDTFELSISSPSTGDLIRKVEDATGLSLRDGRHQLLYGTQVLDADRPLASYGIGEGAAVAVKLLPVEPAGSDADEEGAGGKDTLPDGSPRLESPLHKLHGHLQRARAGLLDGQAPRLAAAGTGGAYFLKDSDGSPVAVFKPEDEEPLAANNPKGRAAAAAPAAPRGAASVAAGGEGAIVGGAAAAAAAPGEGLRRGLRPGEGAVREVAAYILDHGRFSGVPATAMVALEVGGAAAAPPPDAAAGFADLTTAVGLAAVAKVGSLQQYESFDSDCEEMGVSGLPVREVHKIAVLDLRLGNTDRNGSNILARRNSEGAWELVPIDHGCCLPDSFEDISFEWAYWPQAEAPFDPATREYIATLDADRDAAALAAHGLWVRPGCLRVLRVCTAVLKKGAAAGLTPAQIAGVVSRQAPDEASAVEKLHAAAAAAAGGDESAGFDEAVYLETMDRLVDELLEDLVLDDAAQLLI